MIKMRKTGVTGMFYGHDECMRLVCGLEEHRTLSAFLKQFEAILYRDGTHGDYTIDILAKEGEPENGINRVVDLVPLRSNILQIETPWSRDSDRNYKVFMFSDRVEMGIKNTENSIDLLRIWYSCLNYQKNNPNQKIYREKLFCIPCRE